LNIELVIAKEQAQLIDGANTPIFGIGLQGKINEWNLQAAKIAGYSKKEVTGWILRPSLLPMIIRLR
jgi:PAS domain S-box-containing protein